MENLKVKPNLVPKVAEPTRITNFVVNIIGVLAFTKGVSVFVELIAHINTLKVKVVIPETVDW